MDAHWQLQDAKQRLSELLRMVETQGPQFVTRHGEEVAVVVDIVQFRELTGLDVDVNFKEALAGTAALADDVVDVFDSIVAERAAETPRDVDLAESR